MNADPFLDTNILIYTFDRDASDKAERARELTCGTDWQISWQVIQEFSNVAIHRFKTPLKSDDLEAFLNLVLWPRCSVLPSQSVFREALRIQKETQYRFYDSLIVASALNTGAQILYSEDLQHGRRIGDLRIENPFL